MGLRILSVSSLLADSMSVLHLFTQGLSAVSTVSGLVWVAGTVLPSASVVALFLWRRLEKPSREVAHQLAALEANRLQR